MCDAGAFRPQEMLKGGLRTLKATGKAGLMPTKKNLTESVRAPMQHIGDAFAGRRKVKQTEASYENNPLYGTQRTTTKQFGKASKTILGA